MSLRQPLLEATVKIHALAYRYVLVSLSFMLANWKVKRQSETAFYHEIRIANDALDASGAFCHSFLYRPADP